MAVGITGYGAYIPWRRLRRDSIAVANAWFAPNAAGRGSRSMANWDEDSITMAVAAARDLFGKDTQSRNVSQLFLASTTLPFADRQNATVVSEALNLSESVNTIDFSGSQTAALAGVFQAISACRATHENYLFVAADNRKTLPASPQEMTYGDAAAALTIGSDKVIAEFISEASVSVDFVDHFRRSDREVDYQWEERWVRDEGIGKLLPGVIDDALARASLDSDQIDHFVFPTTFKRMDQQLAKKCGIPAESIVGNFSESVGDSGVAHGLLMLASVLQRAKPGEKILLCQFGSGARAMIFEVTEAIQQFRPVRGVEGWLQRNTEETDYMRFLAYKGQIKMDQGMRGEQDKKTALSTSYRYRKALLGMIAGKCRETGDVHFPPTRFSYTPGAAKLDTQEPYPLSERNGRVRTWSAEYLSSDMSPPHQYGQIDFDGGGRLLMDFTDVRKGDVATGIEVEMVFRIKDVDELRGFKRYFWKATPV